MVVIVERVTGTRIDLLDYLRGVAMLGIVLVNSGSLLSAYPPEADTVDYAYWRFLYLFIEGRFYPIFTFLFGVGMHLFITRAKIRGKNGRVLFVRRLVVLFIFGLVHMQFHPGEALTIYSIAGLILLPFYSVNRRINLIFGIMMLIVLSLFAFKILMVVPLMLLGIAAGQYHVFEKISLYKKTVTGFTVIMFVLSITGIILQLHMIPGGTESANTVQTQHFLNMGITIGPVISAFYIGAMIGVLQSPICRKVLAPIKSYGRMAFTNYLMQTVFILIAGTLLQLKNHIFYLQTLYVCLAIYVIQLLFSTIWLHYFRYGPFEWIWRALTYGELPPMQKRKKEIPL
ncbi:putative membrane protein YeiB [Neobacillus cucumis]|nr:putative membrane protein YeiB [Neobacillus cucumis]